MEIMPTGSLDKLEKDMKDLYQAYSKRSGQVDENKPEHKQKSKEELSQEPKQEPTYQGPTHKKLVTFVEKKLYNQIVKDDLFEVTNIITDKTTSEATKAMVTYLLYMARDKHPALYEKLMGLLSFYRLTPSEELQAQYDAHPAFDSLKLPDFEFCKEYACMEREDYDSIKETYDKFGPFRYFAASKPENVRIVMKDEYSFYVGETRPGTDIREGMGISIRRSEIREGYWSNDKQHFPAAIANKTLLSSLISVHRLRRDDVHVRVQSRGAARGVRARQPRRHQRKGDVRARQEGRPLAVL